MPRSASVAVGLAVLLLLSVALSPTTVRGQASPIPPIAAAITFVSAEAVDPDASGHFQNLRIDAIVFGTGTGVMQVSAMLTPLQRTVTIAYNLTFLPFDGSAPTADRTVSVLLPGPPIRAAGIDGPYGLVLTAMGWTSDGLYGAGDISNTTVTPPFAAVSFSPWWAEFGGPPAYATPDADGDGLYDALVVHVPLRVTATVPMTLIGTLSVGNDTVAFVSDPSARSPSPGAYIWDVRLDGPAIRASHLDGPYRLWLLLSFAPLSPGTDLGQVSQTFTTPAYDAADFDPPSAVVRGPITSSLEPSRSGVASALEVLHVPLHVRTAGGYEVMATPFVPFETFGPAPRMGPNTTSVRDLALPAGDTVVDLPFSSVFLSRLPEGTDFTVWVSARRFGTPYEGPEWVPWTEHNVTASELPPMPLATVALAATVSGQACPLTVAEAFDPGGHFFVFSLGPGLSGPESAIVLPLYPGTFDLYVAGCDRSVLQSLAVSGTENVTIALPPPASPPDRYVVTLPTWNRSVTELTSSRWPGAAARVSADLAGDFDGSASLEELSLYLQAAASATYTAWHLTLDGSDVWPTSATVLGVQGAGPDLSAQPVTVSLRWDTPVPVPARSGPRHTVVVTMEYLDHGLDPYQVELHLPSGATGDLHASASAWYGTIPIEPANLSVESLGSGAWLLTPGGSPTADLGATPVATVTVAGATSAAAGSPEVAVATVAIFVGAGIAALVAAYVALRRLPRPKP